MHRSVDEQIQQLLRGVVDIVSAEELQRKLARAEAEGRTLRVKFGIDPTGTDITLGHTVPLRKLRQFQELGHHCILVIGDYTATIGDPTDRNTARPQLTHAQTRANAERYLEQAARVLDIGRIEVRYNSEWLASMAFADVTRLAASTTVARMLEREDFANRYASGTPIHLHEFLYPLMQGYDSVVLQSDVELGGTDQRFNLLAGRDLQRLHGIEPQVCMMYPLIEGLDGVAKMSKSLNNYIGLTHSPDEIFGRTMSIPDHLIVRYFTYFTSAAPAEIEAAAARLAQGVNPRDVKLELGRAIITACGYTPAEARAACEGFLSTFSRGEVPENLPEVMLATEQLPITAQQLLQRTGLAESGAAARRLIEQGGFSADGERVLDPQAVVAVVDGMVLRAGKRRWIRLRLA